MGSGSSLRARLAAGMLAIITVTLGTAAVVGLLAFDRMVKQQAQRVVDANMNVAFGLLSDRIASVDAAVEDVGEDLAVSTGDLRVLLQRGAESGELTYMAVVGADGTVAVNSLGAAPHPTSWDQLRIWAQRHERLSGLAILPSAELAAAGLAPGTLEVKETPNGTVVPGEEEGALAIVAITPYGDGVVIGVKVLKLDYALVDSVESKVGGTATIFQHGVRVATTVRNDQGERAIGTVVSDEVRAMTLDQGKPFQGSAFVVNKEYRTSYRPLRDSTGATIGMLYVGVDNSPYVAATRQFGLIFGGVMLLALAVGAISAFNMSRALSRPLGALNVAAEAVATGDLTTRVPSEGYREVRDLAQSFNMMTGGLKDIIAQVDQSVRELYAVSSQISASSQTSAEYVTQQASSVAETTATLEELTRSFQSVADGARRVLHLAEDTLESAQEGVQSVDRTHAAMDTVASAAHDMSLAAGEMSDVTHEISDMTYMITGIAEQTKILALNAAIEAARAGEAGKGFAVVSTEIRALADSVARSANTISARVNDIQAASGRLQAAAGNQASLTESTVALSEESRRTFIAIVDQMGDTTVAAREIAEATVQQTRASDQMVEAMQTVATGSTQTVQAARELAAAATAVEREARAMRNQLTAFRTT